MKAKEGEPVTLNDEGKSEIIRFSRYIYHLNSSFFSANHNVAKIHLILRLVVVNFNFCLCVICLMSVMSWYIHSFTELLFTQVNRAAITKFYYFGE